MTINIDILKDLTQTTYDSVEGYRMAAEKADSPVITQAFERRSQERSQTLGKLNDALQANGETPINRASATGTAHQMFLEVTEALGDSTEAAIKRVEEGEDYIAEQFRNVLDRDDLDTDMRTLVSVAFTEVREGERFSDMLEQQYA